MDQDISQAILTEIKKIAGEVTELRVELRSEIGGLRSEVGELRTGLNEVRSEVRDLRTEMRTGFAAVNSRLDRVENDVRVIREQTGNLTERITRLEKNANGPFA